jgi:hypothetical protein
MKNKYVQNISHILVILISLYVWNIERPFFSAEDHFIRTVLTAVVFAHVPYLFLAWTKVTRSFAVYVCLVWMIGFSLMKMGI